METRQAEKLDYQTTVHLFEEDLLYLKRKLVDVNIEAIRIENKINHASRQCAFLKDQIRKIDAENL